ncbi:hypothetical protein C8A03DRAFT_38900 [Achaetomium macrosporum]|uniref:PLD phosphodiesterase domain-containing protein n=1 Tax=Achaetomium macrosporum TaxID=79813 RepID=A0AAN7C232_9PEZI|nr:hypothetical protein C8A03DRAFT_38900 [Achaetomium macrosporum]
MATTTLHVTVMLQGRLLMRRGSRYYKGPCPASLLLLEPETTLRNDAGELLPHQGGHNEKVSSHLHTSLPPTVRHRLHYHWYVAKDQTRPIPQSRRQRSSHVKLMIVDGQVAIQGNGNQDTQSWFHSQEVNVMVDSEALCGEWLAVLRRNQNTEVFGRVRVTMGCGGMGRGGRLTGRLGLGLGGLGGC